MPLATGVKLGPYESSRPGGAGQAERTPDSAGIIRVGQSRAMRNGLGTTWQPRLPNLCLSTSLLRINSLICLGAADC
jgi:hypothetical protein